MLLKHLVLLAGIYYPHPSPTGKCAERYISLLKDEFRISVIYIQSDLRRNYGISCNNETLYGLSNWRLYIESLFFDLCNKTKIKMLKILCLLGIKVMKVIGRIQTIFFYPDNLRWYYKKAYRTLNKIHRKDPISVIFTVNSPFAAHLAGMAFKRRYPQIKWITYTVDPFHISSKIGWKNKFNNKAFLAEQTILQQADVNFLSEEVYVNSRDLYNPLQYKTFPLPYLLPDNDEQIDSQMFDPNKTNLVYAGRFYKNIRNPECLLKTFTLINSKDLVLHLYSASDCDEIITKYVKQSHGQIVNHKFVDQREIQRVMNSADILVNVGNTVSEFKPSKTFEYIVTGHPILNFYYNNQIDEVLEKYPLALQLKYDEEEIYINAKAIESFCIQNKNMKVAKSELMTLYDKHSKENIRNRLLTYL